MGRTLPWLAQGSSTKTSRPLAKRAVPGKPANRPTKRVKRGDDDGGSPRDLAASDAGNKSATPVRPGSRVLSAFKKQDAAGRWPSSSPPPLEEPVEEEFMREGLKQDDIYMMVEDEFYDVARIFTAHIHQQEYDRLRREAREINATRTTTIARPVDGRTTLPRDVKVAKERQAAEKKRRKDLASILHSDSETKTDCGEQVQTKGKGRSWHGTLGGLMDSPSKASKSLMGLHGPSIDSRAAAGFKEAQVTPSKQRTLMRPQSKDETGDVASEDDLDASPSVMSRKNPTRLDQAASANAPAANRHRSSSPPISLAINDWQVGQNYKSGSIEGIRGPSSDRATSAASAEQKADENLDDFFKPRPLISSRRNRGAYPKV